MKYVAYCYCCEYIIIETLFAFQIAVENTKPDISLMRFQEW